MLRKVMRAKIHRATITQADLNYVGSITIDEDLLREAGIAPNEGVAVYDIDNGARFETYVIRGEAGSGIIGINGAAARLVEVGHKLIIVAFGYLQHEAINDHVAKVVVVDESNKPAKVLRYDSALPVTEAV